MLKVAIIGQEEIYQSDKFDVPFYDDGENAYELLKSTPIDFALIDIFMKKADGLKLIKDFSLVKFIVATQLNSDVYKHYAKKLGCVEYLQKPVSLEDLEAVLEKHIKD